MGSTFALQKGRVTCRRCVFAQKGIIIWPLRGAYLLLSLYHFQRAKMVSSLLECNRHDPSDFFGGCAAGFSHKCFCCVVCPAFCQGNRLLHQEIACFPRPTHTYMDFLSSLHTHTHTHLYFLSSLHTHPRISCSKSTTHTHTYFLLKIHYTHTRTSMS